jgi:hypothetical protein
LSRLRLARMPAIAARRDARGGGAL